MPRAVSVFGYLLLGLSILYIASEYNESIDRGRCDSVISSPVLGPVRVGSMISRGSFSLVMEGTVLATSASVAIKIGMDAGAGLDTDRLVLSSFNESEYFPFYYGSGSTFCEKRSGKIIRYPYIIMERLGRPLMDLVSLLPDRHDRVRTALIAAGDVLSGLEQLHGIGLLQHDLYPQNVLATLDSGAGSWRFKLIDFGEAILLRDGAKEYKMINHLYTTLREDKREPISQRDDLERLAYLIIGAVEGKMPWEVENADATYRRILKARMSVGDTCRGLPRQVAQILEYARNDLQYGQPIDFPFVRTLLATAADQATAEHEI